MGKQPDPFQCHNVNSSATWLGCVSFANIISSYPNSCQEQFLRYCFSCRLDITPQPKVLNNTTFVVGMSGEYPGEGIGVAGFLKSLTTEEDLPQTVPFERWNLEEYYTPEARGDLTMYARMASFLGKLENFDASLFRLDS